MMLRLLGTVLAVMLFAGCESTDNQAEPAAVAESQPNVILLMADDMGWAQTGYYGHPVMKTPNLDAMAANGLRMDRFYAGAPSCTPTRASVMTGRTNDRTGAFRVGESINKQDNLRETATKTRQLRYNQSVIPSQLGQQFVDSTLFLCSPT